VIPVLCSARQIVTGESKRLNQGQDLSISQHFEKPGELEEFRSIRMLLIVICGL